MNGHAHDDRADLAFELHDLVLTMDRDTRAILKPLGLTLNQHIALVIINEHPGLRGRDLAQALDITPAGATGIVKALTAASLIKDTTRLGQGNRQSLHLTTDGQERLRRSTIALSGSFDATVRDLGHDPEQLARALRDITNHLKTR